MEDVIEWFPLPGERIALAAWVSNKWTWVIDGVASPGFDVISLPAFTSDGQHFAYAGANANKGFGKTKTKGAVIEDGKVVAEHEGRGFGGFLAGSVYNPAVMLAGINTLTADFHGVSDPQYTKDGKLVYVARRADNKVAVFVGGTPGPDFEDIISSSIGLSADGRHTAYFVKRGDYFLEVRDHVAGASFLTKRSLSWVDWLEIDPAGEHVASVIISCGKSEKVTSETIVRASGRCLRRVVIDGQGGVEYDARDIADFALSPDGRSHAYAVFGLKDPKDERDDHSLVVLNGRETKPYDAIFAHSLKVVDDRTVTFVAYDGKRFLRVTATTAAQPSGESSR